MVWDSYSRRNNFAKLFIGRHVHILRYLGVVSREARCVKLATANSPRVLGCRRSVVNSPCSSLYIICLLLVPSKRNHSQRAKNIQWKLISRNFFIREIREIISLRNITPTRYIILLDVGLWLRCIAAEMAFSNEHHSRSCKHRQP